ARQAQPMGPRPPPEPRGQRLDIAAVDACRGPSLTVDVGRHLEGRRYHLAGRQEQKGGSLAQNLPLTDRQHPGGAALVDSRTPLWKPDGERATPGAGDRGVEQVAELLWAARSS